MTTVDRYLARSKKWPDAAREVRDVLLTCGLEESIKWGKPCYSDGGKHIAIIQEMNDFLAVMFFKGVLLADPEQILVLQGPNSRSAKRIEFTSVAQVKQLAATVRSYVAEAIEIERSGQTVGPAPELQLVDELRKRLADDDQLREAFERLTPGRQREFHLFISSAKQASTRESRVDKCVPTILAGKGLRDR
jgi:uncharacterized protein YdeI (YjbR/CyaY-like superfamily)